MLPTPSSAPLTRLVIPKAKVDARIVTLGIDGNGVMQSTSNAYDIAWYDFSARPGAGGNAVFSGHVDYHDVGPAVFWNLRDLQPGDVIEVHLDDGTVYTLRRQCAELHPRERGADRPDCGPYPNRSRDPHHLLRDFQQLDQTVRQASGRARRPHRSP